MAREKMLAHAEHWIAAWNRRDVEAVLRALAASAGFISPKATDLEGTSRLQGKPAIGDYWRRALANVGGLGFRLDHVTCDVGGWKWSCSNGLTLNGATTGACELMQFEAAGLQVFGEARYGAPA